MTTNIETLQNLIENQEIELKIDIKDEVTLNKKLFTYQKEALVNAQKVLDIYFNEYNANKELFCKDYYYLNELYSYLHIPVNELKISKREIEEFFKVVLFKNKEVILFNELVNRVSFWMATGSGKTIVIIKLIEMLFDLMDNGIVPQKDILFLTYREDLLTAFVKLVQEYNQNKSLDKRIEIFSLKDYEYYKINPSFGRQIFIYRSDLISNERKENILNYRDYLSEIDNKTIGNWYLILDEAHKGATDSKRQTYYSILSKNGFLFNFSATFVELIDKVTTIYNLNLNEFIKRGYGKQIYVFQDEIKQAFKKQKDFETIQKEKIILKNFVLLSAVKKAFHQLPKGFYHNPMLVFLMNSVNIDNSDLILIFKEIAKLAKGINKHFLKEVKEELIAELHDVSYIIGNGSLNDLVTIIKYVDEKSIYKDVFNSDDCGNVEIKRTKNNQELILKLDTSDKPFALIKIGNTTDLVKKRLAKLYKIDNSFEEDSYFSKLNEEDSTINILLGSRAFYEGWDSNRPNIITFINIGTGNEAKKFVLQAIGRGVRIEPIKGYRQRLSFIKDKNKIRFPKDKFIESKFLETLFIFATNKNAVETILKELQSIKISDSFKEISLNKNDNINLELFYPVYTDKKNDITSISNPLKFNINKDDLELFLYYIKCIPQNLFLIKYNIDKETYNKIIFILNNIEKFFKIDSTRKFYSIETIINSLINYVNLNIKYLKEFCNLEDNCIIHFKKIKIKSEKIQDFKRMLEITSYIPEKETIPFDNVYITKLATHYYNPIIYINPEYKKINWIKNIIDIPSEGCFIKSLINVMDVISNKYDWYFSKLNEKYDKKIFIPYLKNGELHSYYPDFIFWLKEKYSNNYRILFIDPKGMSYSDYQAKIEGFKKIFERNNKPKIFKKNNLNITVYLKMFSCEEIDGMNNYYLNYWTDKNTLLQIF